MIRLVRFLLKFSQFGLLLFLVGCLPQWDGEDLQTTGTRFNSTFPTSLPGYVVELSPSPKALLPSPTIPAHQAEPQSTSFASKTPVLTPTNVQGITPVLQLADIQIFQPGNGSRVIAPIQVNALLNYSTSGPYHLELLGADGQLLYRKVWSAPDKFTGAIWISESINFEIAQPEETARLRITRLDAFGRLQAINSIDLVLITTGEDIPTQSSALYQAISILSPGTGEEITGGILMVKGNVNFYTDEPLRIQLVAEDIQVVGQRVASVQYLEGAEANFREETGTFLVEVPYKVNSRTPVRLIIYALDRTTSTITHLSSLELILNP